jgi:hypothetical protein
MYILKNYKDTLKLCLCLCLDERIATQSNDVNTKLEKNDWKETNSVTVESAIKTCDEMNQRCNSMRKELADTTESWNPIPTDSEKQNLESKEWNEWQPIKAWFQIKEWELVLEWLPQSWLKEWDEIQLNLEWIPEDNSLKGLPTYGWFLPETIASVEVGWVIYERQWTNWEFVDQNGKSLEIEKWQTLSISQTRSKEELTRIKKEASSRYEELKKENPELWQYEEQVTAAIEKGISPNSLLDNNLLNFILSLFGIDKKWDAIWYHTLWWEWDGKSFWRTSFNVSPYNGVDNPNLRPWTIKNYSVPTKSEPYAHSWTSTLCSQTARLNLEKMWAIWVTHWNAFDAWRQMWSPKQPFPPKGDWNIRAIDLFVASKSQYWHRAAAFIKDWEWFVLDPYRNWKSTTPISAKEYMAKNQVVGAYHYSLG